MENLFLSEESTYLNWTQTTLQELVLLPSSRDWFHRPLELLILVYFGIVSSVLAKHL